MKATGNILLAIVMGAGFLMMIEFVILNMIMGCQTWDRTLWTETSSCVTFRDMIGILR